MADEKTFARTFTRAELAAFNGQEGRPAYIAYKGVSST
jgi:predicted heme/steroid binding protein